jgi:hypothetical protein
MFSLFQQKPKERKYVGFDDIKYALDNTKEFILINTITAKDQEILIKMTICADEEEEFVNDLIVENTDREPVIIVYGMNSADDTVEKKYKQLVSLGFSRVFIYSGGLFEWVLLQELYGENEFPTTGKVKDFLKYRVKPYFQ